MNDCKSSGNSRGSGIIGEDYLPKKFRGLESLFRRLVAPMLHVVSVVVQVNNRQFGAINARFLQ